MKPKFGGNPKGYGGRRKVATGAAACAVAIATATFGLTEAAWVGGGFTATGTASVG